MSVSESPRKSYGQCCGLARALDVVGDRWTLLVVRELLLGPRRYAELREALGGIATNLLASRLRQLESDGVVVRELGAEPADGVRYALSSWGEGLGEVVRAFVRWSVPLMARGQDDDVFRPSWLAIALPALLEPRLEGLERPVRIAIETVGERFVLDASREGILVLPWDDSCRPTLKAPPDIVFVLAAGKMTLTHAKAKGARVAGAREVQRLFPEASRGRKDERVAHRARS